MFFYHSQQNSLPLVKEKNKIVYRELTHEGVFPCELTHAEVFFVRNEQKLL